MRPRWPPRNRPRAARAGASTRSAAASKLPLDLSHRLLGQDQEAQDRAAVRLRDDVEHRFHALYIPHRAYTCQGMYKWPQKWPRIDLFCRHALSRSTARLRELGALDRGRRDARARRGRAHDDVWDRPRGALPPAAISGRRAPRNALPRAQTRGGTAAPGAMVVRPVPTAAACPSRASTRSRRTRPRRSRSGGGDEGRRTRVRGAGIGAVLFHARRRRRQRPPVQRGDDDPARPSPVAVINERLWQRWYGIRERSRPIARFVSTASPSPSSASCPPSFPACPAARRSGFRERCRRRSPMPST